MQLNTFIFTLLKQKLLIILGTKVPQTLLPCLIQTTAGAGGDFLNWTSVLLPFTQPLLYMSYHYNRDTKGCLMFRRKVGVRLINYLKLNSKIVLTRHLIFIFLNAKEIDDCIISVVFHIFTKSDRMRNFLEVLVLISHCCLVWQHSLCSPFLFYF